MSKPHLTIFVGLAALSASGASFTTCSILNPATRDVLAQTSGDTACSVQLEPTIPGAPRHGSAAFVDNGWVGLTGRARAFANNIDYPMPVRVESQAYGSGQDYASFSNIGNGNFLQIDFNLSNGGTDHSFQFAFNDQPFNTFGRHSILLPIDPASPVGINPYLRVFCVDFCLASTSFGITGLDVVNAAGDSQSGYQYSFESGRRFSPSAITFPGGENVASIPEPGAVALVLMGLAVLAGIHRRRRAVT